MCLRSLSSICFAVGLFLLISCSNSADDSRTPPPTTPKKLTASGTFAPDGKPVAPPSRVDAGRSCIVDLRQLYTTSGTLSGTLDISYRIKVDGPCGSPIGTFDEEWIAHGVFDGEVDGQSKHAAFTYVAKVRAGGDVSGTIVLGQGLDGELQVTGNFSDGKLNYKGWLTR